MSEIDLEQCHFGFIGAGNIATALVTGFLKSGTIKASQICVSAPSDANLNKFKELGCFTTNSNNDVFKNAERVSTRVLFLCIKPQVFKDKFSLDLDQLKAGGFLLIISVMAGITINQLQGLLREKYSFDTRIVRLIPNTAVSLCAGICGISHNNNDDSTTEFLTRLLSPLGLCQFVTEQQLNAVCGLGGSGIAFVYSLIHAMSDGGLKMGLPRSVSTNIAAQTVLGAALMVQQTGKNPIVLRDEVTSPGGTTIHGLHALEKGAFSSVVIDAIESATERANQLS